MNIVELCVSMGIEYFVVGVSFFLVVLVLLFTVLALLWPTWDSSQPQEVLTVKRKTLTKNADSTLHSRKKKRRKHHHVHTSLTPLIAKEEIPDRTAQVQPTKTLYPNLHTPCTGCGVVNAKKNCSYTCCASCCRGNKDSVCHAHGTSYRAARAAVATAVQHRLTEFDLSYGQLSRYPPALVEIGPQLVSLNLSNNRLRQLPPDIGVFVNLQELFLQYNYLTELPESVCDLYSLFELDVKNNNLKRLPDDIGNLVNLGVLSLTNNMITSLPKGIGCLINLEEFSLHCNHLTELPDEFCKLVNLKVMYAGENKFQTLPNQFGRLVHLEELDLSGCELIKLPESFSNCVSLVRLWLSNNKLQVLPCHIGHLQKLKELHIRHNKIRYFPASIQQLQLYTFTAQHNSLIDDDTARRLCIQPLQRLPSLLELAAREVTRFDSSWEHGFIPSHLHDMLMHPFHCTNCGGPLFSFYYSQVTFKTIGVFCRAPLYQQLCSYKCYLSCCNPK